MNATTARRGVGTLACLALLAVLVAYAAVGAAAKPAGSGAATTTLTVAVDNGSPTLQENFNPFSASKRIGTTYMYAPLEFVNPLDGTYTPFLATGHSFAGNRTLRFTIRNGAKWSDGTPLTAADVTYTFGLLKRNAGLDGNGVWQHLRSVSAKGNVVTFRFKTPDVPFAQQIAQTLIVPQHVWSKVGNPTSYTNNDPVVSGPYMLDSFNPNQYVLKKNPRYWAAGSVAADQIVFPALTGNQTSQLQLSRGAYDWATLFIPNVQSTWVAKDSAHNKFWFPPGGTITLYLNLTKAPFSSLGFRQGLSYSLDRSQIALKAENGYVHAASQGGLLLPNLGKWLDRSLPAHGVVAYSPQKAKAAFAKAGYHMQGGKLVGPDGKQVSFSLTTVNGFTDWLQGAQVVQQQLGKLGIKVELKTPQYAQYFSGLQNGDYDTALGGFGGTGSPFLDFNALLSSKLSAPVGKPAPSNFERWHSAQTDALLSSLKATTSPAKQKALTNRLQKVMYTQLPSLALFYGATWGEYSTKNFTGWPSAQHPYAPPAPYGNAPIMIVTHLKAAAQA